MADDNLKVGVDLDVHTSGEELVAALTRQLNKLESQIKRINAAGVNAAKAVRSNPGGSSSTGSTAATTKEAKARNASLLFDREAAKAFKTRIASQAKATAEAMKAERQSFSDYKSRLAAKAKFDASEVRGLRARMTAESRIAAMRAREEAAAVRSLKAKLASQDRAARQRVSESTAAARAEAKQNAESIRSVRDRIASHSRMMRQRLAEEKSVQREQARTIAAAARAENARLRELAAGIRETARIEAREARNNERDRSRRVTDRNRYVSNVRSGLSETREGAGRVIRGSAAVAAVGTGAAAFAARKGISSRLEVDTAETNLKIFSGQTKQQIEDARKGFLDNLSIKNGLGIAGGLDAYSEVLKTGMKAPAENVKTIMEAVSALELDLKNTTKLAGLIDRNYGEKSDPAKIKSALNAVAVAAREDPTQSNEIVEGVKRAFGALSTGNMTPEQLTALVSGGQSVGIQPGKAGTYIATLGKQLSMGNSKFLGKKNRQELNFAAKELGFGDARHLANEYSSKSYDTIMAVQERLAKLEAGKRTQVAEALMGRQWSDEALQFSQGTAGVKKTFGEISDAKNANFLEEAARTRAESLQGQWNTTKTIFGRFWDAFGAGFEDILTGINKYFLELNETFDYGNVKQYVNDFFDGVKEALGVTSWREYFTSLFGGDIREIGPSIRAFAKGLTDGVMSIGRAIRSFASVFGGGDVSAETIGNLAGKFVALTAALVMLGPVLGILGGLTSLVVGLAVAAKGIAGLAGLATRGAAGGAAGAAAGTGVLFKGLGLALSRMFALTVVAEIGANRGVISTWLLDAGKSILNAAVDGLKQAFSKESIQAAMRGIVSEFIPAPVQRWLDSDGKLEEKNGLGKKTLEGLPKGIPAPTVPAAPTERGVIGRAWDWLSESLVGKANASELLPPRKSEAPSPILNPATDIQSRASEVRDNANPVVQFQSYSENAGLSALVQKASLTSPSTVLAGSVGTEPLDPRAQIIGLTHAVEENTIAIRAGLDRQGAFGGLIHRATLSTTAPADAVKASLADSATGVRSAALSGSVGSGVMSGGRGPLGNSVPGSSLNGGGGLSRRGIIGGGGDYTPAPNSMAGKTFASKAPGIMANLMNDFSLSKEQAAGVLGNLGHESAGMTAYQEAKPLGGGRGGAGWAQWTGPRRQAFEAWSARNGLDPRSDAANYGFLKHELTGSHAGALASLKRQTTVDGATIDFERTYEAAGVKHYGSRLGYARRAMGLDPNSATPNPDAGSGGGDSPSSGAADVASRYLGMHELRNRGELTRFLGRDPAGNANAWCASFVNASLKAVGQSGTGSAVANSFLRWGKAISNEMVERGDVLVEHRNKGVDGQGGHVGIATGRKRINPNTGKLELESISGNSSDSVKTEWEDASKILARRSMAAAKAAAESVKAPVLDGLTSTGWKRRDGSVVGSELASQAAEIKSSGWRPGAGNNAPALGVGGPESAAPPPRPTLGDNVPPRIGNTAPIGGSRGGGSGGGSQSINAPITINGTGLDPQAIASAVQRRLQEDMSRRTHDLSPASI